MTFAFIFESVGGTEWLVLLGVVLIVVGPKNLPAAARKMGQIMATLRRAADEFKRQIMTMDQEVRKTVEEAASDGSASTAGETANPADASAAADDGSDLYSDDNPYPGYEDYYDETDYQDGSDGQPAGETAAATVETPAAKPPPTDAELRTVKITVTTDGAEKGSAA